MASKKKLALGMIGLDTSHCKGFAKELNKWRSKTPIKYGFPGGSEIFSHSYNRVEKFTKELESNHSVGMQESIGEVAEKSDAIFLTSCDGRQHLKQFKVLSEYGKPVFIDKPFACSLSDAKKIIELSRTTYTPVFSTSSLRYYNGIHHIADGRSVRIAEVHGPAPLLDDYPGYFWYGIHSAEILYSVLGTGCEQVKVEHNKNFDYIIGQWENGRKGIIFGCRYDKKIGWGARLLTDREMIVSKAQNDPSGLSLMLPYILEFFRTGKSPIRHEVMLEITAFLEAVNQGLKISKPITLNF